MIIVIPQETLFYLLLYVDDMLIASTSMFNSKTLKEQLNGEFEMKRLRCS